MTIEQELEELRAQIDVERGIHQATEQHANSLEVRLAKRLETLQQVVREKAALQNELHDLAADRGNLLARVLQLTAALNSATEERDRARAAIQHAIGTSNRLHPAEECCEEWQVELAAMRRATQQLDLAGAVKTDGDFSAAVLADALQSCPKCFCVFQAQPLEQEGGAL